MTSSPRRSSSSGFFSSFQPRHLHLSAWRSVSTAPFRPLSLDHSSSFKFSDFFSSIQPYALPASTFAHLSPFSFRPPHLRPSRLQLFSLSLTSSAPRSSSPVSFSRFQPHPFSAFELCPPFTFRLSLTFDHRSPFSLHSVWITFWRGPRVFQEKKNQVLLTISAPHAFSFHLARSLVIVPLGIPAAWVSCRYRLLLLWVFLWFFLHALAVLFSFRLQHLSISGCEATEDFRSHYKLFICWQSPSN